MTQLFNSSTCIWNELNLNHIYVHVTKYVKCHLKINERHMTNIAHFVDNQLVRVMSNNQQLFQKEAPEN